MTDYWFAAQLKPNKQKLAIANLRRQGFEPFLPVREVSQSCGNRWKNKLEPLFPGYLFISGSEDPADWRKMNNTLGVSRLVTERDLRPGKMPQGFVEDLIACCDDAQTFRAPDKLKAGQTVRVINGPFSGLFGEIEKLSKDQRVAVLFELLGQSVRTFVSTRHVEVA